MRINTAREVSVCRQHIETIRRHSNSCHQQHVFGTFGYAVDPRSDVTISSSFCLSHSRTNTFTSILLRQRGAKYSLLAFACFGSVLFLLAATVVLSLIPLYLRKSTVPARNERKRSDLIRPAHARSRCSVLARLHDVRRSSRSRRGRWQSGRGCEREDRTRCECSLCEVAAHECFVV